MELNVAPLEEPSEAEVAKMLELFVASFAPEPGFQYMFQHPSKRMDDITWAATLKFALVRPRLEMFGAHSDAGVLHGFSWWIPPDKTPFFSLWQQLRVGYGWAPFRCGLGGFRRMLRFGSQERVLVEKYTAQPIWVLDTIAVDLSIGRQGLGGRLLAKGLARAEETGHDCFVLTHNDRNVRFYEKYGFRLEEVAPIEETGVSAYCLVWRAP